MDWKTLVTELTNAGMTQEDIAVHCGVAQSSISSLQRGITKSPSFDVGTKLVALHTLRKPQETKAA